MKIGKVLLGMLGGVVQSIFCNPAIEGHKCIEGLESIEYKLHKLEEQADINRKDLKDTVEIHRKAKDAYDRIVSHMNEL